MQTPGFRWDDLQLLLALCRRGSLKSAASQLGVNISTVGRRLDAFEQSVSLHLFDRTPEGTRPTAAAEQLVPFAESMERAAMGFSHALDGLEAEPEGLVRITAPPGVVDHFLAADIAELLARHPRLTVEILSTIGYADLTRREADLALRIMRPARGDLISTKLGTFTSTMLVSPTVAAEVGTLRDLNDLRWVTYAEDLGHLPETSWISSQVAPDRIVMRSNSMSAHLAAVRSGLGATLAPTPYAGLEGLTELSLSRPLAKKLRPLPEGSLWLVGHRALRDVPRIAATWSFLSERFRGVVGRRA